MRATLVLVLALAAWGLVSTTAHADFGVLGHCERAQAWGTCRTAWLPDFERHNLTEPATVFVAQPAGLEERRAAAREVICRPEFTWPCAWALDVVFCESSFYPYVVGSEFYEPLGRTIYFVGYWQRYIGGATSEAEALAGSLGPYGDTVDAHRQFREWVEGKRSVSPWPGCGPVKPI